VPIEVEVLNPNHYDVIVIDELADKGGVAEALAAWIF
jgi:spermidine synthase